MDTIWTNNLLLSLPFKGCIWFALLFFLCFFGAHITKLAKEGWRARRQPPEEKPKDEPKKEPPKPSQAQEPVYYIVEKKRRRPKQEYGEPKPIRFQ